MNGGRSTRIDDLRAPVCFFPRVRMYANIYLLQRIFVNAPFIRHFQIA